MAGKRKVTQADISRRVDVDQGSVSRILNQDTRDSFSDETVRKVFKVARELGYLHPALLSTNRRLSGRKLTGLRVRLKIVTGSNTVFDEGSCEVAEISESGCLLRRFKTRKKSFPMTRFVFDVEINEQDLKHFYSRCRLIRFSDTEEDFTVAVQYEGPSEDRKDKLREFLG